MEKNKTYHRYFALEKKVPGITDHEEFRQNLIWQCTNGRTTSLKELTRGEYETCCQALEKLTGLDAKRKKLRSQVLTQMGRLDINSNDWAQVNSFCQQPRIAGKPFARLSIEELENLSVKLRALKSKGWHHKTEETPKATVVMVMPTAQPKNATPS